MDENTFNSKKITSIKNIFLFIFLFYTFIRKGGNNMKKTKKIAFYFFVLFLFFTFQNHTSAAEVVYTNSKGVKMTQAEYDNLKNLGFSDMAIDQMEQEIFDENKDLVVYNKVEVTKYYETTEIPIKEENNTISNTKPLNLNNLTITTDNDNLYLTKELSKEEYYKKVQSAKMGLKNGSYSVLSDDTTSTSYRTLTTSIVELTNKKYRLKSEFKWDIMPKTRKVDTLSTSIDNYFTPIAQSEFGQQLWSYWNPSNPNAGFKYDSVSYSRGSSKYTRQSAGYGLQMDLKDDDTGYKLFELSGYMYYDIEKSSSIIPTYVNAYGNYAHLTENTSLSYSISLSYGSPSISFSGISSSKFDSITTHAQVKYK